MRSLLQRRPSASMVVAVVALVAGTSGSAVAASRIVSGDQIVRKGTLSGNRLRRHTLTGTQINLKKLGTVPSAKTAGYAGNAGSAGYAVNATNATDATNATHAGSADSATNAGHANSADNAGALGGQPASSYLHTSSRVGTGGTFTMAGTVSGATATLFRSGPFTVTMTCTTTSSGDTAVAINAASAESGSVIDGASDVPANTQISLGSFGRSPDPQVGGGSAFTLEAPSGAGVVFAGSFGTNSAGEDNGCWANFAGIA